MSSADLFLRLLEEKDLVSAEVVRAARHEIERSSPPLDAVRLSLWLVQGQHLTAAQADRLLSAVAEKTEIPGPIPPAPKLPQPKAAERQRPESQTRAPGRAPSTQSRGQPGVPALPPKSPGSQRPAALPADDLELAPLEESQRKPGSSSRDLDAVPWVSPPGKGLGEKNPAAVAKAGNQDNKSTAAAAKSGSQDKKNPAVVAKAGHQEKKDLKIGGDLESLESTMQGPLDALLESEGLASDLLAGPQLNPAVPKKFKLRRFLRNLLRRDKSQVVRIKAADPRQVKLVLISWGIAVVAAIGLLWLGWFYSPRSPSDVLQKADDAMMVEDFGQAISLCDEFLKHYPAAPNVDDVRLLRCLAELRAAERNAVASGDWTSAFTAAKAQVDALPMARADSTIMKKFAVALAKIGEGLAQEAIRQADKQSVDRVRAVMNMIETEVPEKSRPADAMLDGIKRTVKPVVQAVEGRRELDQTVEEIGSAVKEDNLQAAYKAYREFVKSYPELTDDVRLADAMKQVSASRQKAVKSASQSLAAAREERPSGLLAAMPLAVQAVKGEVGEARGKLVFAVEQGTAYGLDAASGKTLWRRFVALDGKSSAIAAERDGYAISPAVTALPIVGPATSDVVLCDRVHQELLRVQGATGVLVWRLAVASPIVAEPARAGKWLLLLTKDQRLLLIDLATGDSPRCFQLPQAVRLPPVTDAAHGLVFLAADASNLIVLDIGRCRQVLHVGHEAGTITAPPAIVGDFLLLPVNDTPREATLRVFSISKDKEGEPLKPVQAIHVAGSIDTSPVAVGRGFAVVTAEGSLFAFERDGAGGKSPFQLVASKPASVQEKATHFAVSGGSTLWVADRQLTCYAVQVDEQRIVPQASRDLGLRFIRPPLIDGGTMFQVLQRSGMPGVTVSAFDLKQNQAVWQTWIAAPMVAEPALAPLSGKLTVVTVSGGLFRAPLGDLKPQVKSWEPILAIDSSRLVKPLCSLLPLAGEMFAMTSGADTKQIVIYDPKEQDKQFRWLLSPRDMSAGPGAFAGGLLTACVDGQVFLLDPEARGDMAKPLEPAEMNGKKWEWQVPLAAAENLAVLSDGDRQLTAVRISSDGEKALTEAAAVKTKNALVSPVALVSKLVFVAVRDAADSTDTLLSFELPNLAPGKSQALGARCAWGPQPAGKLVLVATDKNRLFAIGERQQVLWQADLVYGPLVGAPCLSGDEIFLSARSGIVWRISAADGKELGKVDAGCPLGSGPLVVGSRVIVGGHEGSLLEVKKP